MINSKFTKGYLQWLASLISVPVFLSPRHDSVPPKRQALLLSYYQFLMYFSRDCVGHTEPNIYILCIQILKYFYIITSPTNGGTLNALFNALLYNVSPSYFQVRIQRYIASTLGLEHLSSLVPLRAPEPIPVDAEG